ncbi:hypothetical protein [Bacillus cereus group sp. Bce001]|uniref:hypothetical protein n=1 Tax=Bacillus cereus group sp. Bce001 TaxID=3445260 RepID=UPI003F1E486F
MKRTKIEDLPLWERQVLSLIRHGKANSITVKEIITIIGGTDQSVRGTIRRLIEKHGYLIGSSNTKDTPGFYFPTSEEEKKEAVEKMLHRADDVYKRANIMSMLPLVEV